MNHFTCTLRPHLYVISPDNHDNHKLRLFADTDSQYNTSVFLFPNVKPVCLTVCKSFKSSLCKVALSQGFQPESVTGTDGGNGE